MQTNIEKQWKQPEWRRSKRKRLSGRGNERTTKIERDPVYINYLKCSVILLFRPFLM